QTPALPPPPHESGAAHAPHEATVRAFPQRSVPVKGPQFFPAAVQNAASSSGVQPQAFGCPPPPHVVVPLQVPQLAIERVCPHLSTAVIAPHVACALAQSAFSLSGTHPASHAPQSIDLPQPSSMTPHAAPHAAGTHASWAASCAA